jgi:hypothetical protein
MKELIGKTVKQMLVNENQHILKFVLSDDTAMYYEAEGDCCSETWFADIIFNVQHGWKQGLFPLTVENVEDIEVPGWVESLLTNDGRGRQDYDQVYGEKLVVSGGTVDIIYRNSSNGYYGGWCNFLDVTHGYAQEWISKCEWTEITEDWRA